MKKLILLFAVVIFSFPFLFADDVENLYIDIAVKNEEFSNYTTTTDSISGGILLSKLEGTQFLPYATDSGLVITDNSTSNGTGAFINQRLDISQSFAIAFSVNFNSTTLMWGSTMGDGFMFIVSRSANTVGESGAGLGYAGIRDSFGIEFDDTYNSEAGDDSYWLHTDFRTNGIMTGESGHVKSLDMTYSNFYGKILNNSYNVYTWIEYNADTKVLEARYAFNTTERPSSPHIKIENIDMKKLIKDDYCFIGFTASTGGAFQRQILNCLLFDSTSCKPLDFNKDYHSILLNTCEHENITAHEAVEPTCTEDGMKAYKVCEDCHRTMNMDGYGVFASELVVKASHDWSYSSDATGKKLLASCTRANCEYHNHPIVLNLITNAPVKLSYEVVPLDATTPITFKSLDTSVVSLSDEGDVQINGLGKTKIVASSNDLNAIEKKVEVTVVNPQQLFRGFFINDVQTKFKFTLEGKNYELTYVYKDGDFKLTNCIINGENQGTSDSVKQKYNCFKALDTVELHVMDVSDEYAIYTKYDGLNNEVSMAYINDDTDAKDKFKNLDVIANDLSILNEFKIVTYTKY